AARAATTTPTVVRSAPDSQDEPPPREDDDASVTDIRHRHGRRIRLVASTAALVLLGGGIGSAAAAQQAMPGDALYGVKRSIENVSTTVSVGDGSRGRRDLEHAMTRLSEVQKLADSGGSAGTINSTLDDFSVQARKGVTRLVASYQQDGDESSITAITTFVTKARQALGELAPKLPPESLKSAVEALATVEQLARHTTVACPKCAAKGSGSQPNRPNVSTEPSNPAKPPGASASGKPATTPSKVPNTTILGESNTPPPSLKTPPNPSSSQPTSTPTVVPSIPTPGTTSWPWPLPTLSLPTPIINVPGVIQTLLPPWK
ncbi:MAG TPA: DUF5667 domain-containing protein, partial [Kribbella sp.]|nr:DUF5667 domain-containing protein [Kribbella sp.]